MFALWLAAMLVFADPPSQATPLPASSGATAAPTPAPTPDPQAARKTALADLAAGEKLQRAGHHAQATAVLTDAITADPTLMDAYLVRAVSRAQLGDVDGAYGDLEIVLGSRPHDVKALTALGMLEEEKRYPTDALADFSRAIAIQPSYVPARMARGTLNCLTGRKSDGLADLDHALHAAAPTKESLTLQALSRANFCGDLRGGAAYARRAIALGATEQPLFDLVTTDDEVSGRFDLAYQDYKADVRANPKSETARAALASAESDMPGMIQAAITDYGSAIHLSPQDPALYFDRAAVEKRSGQVSDALADYKAALKLYSARGDTVHVAQVRVLIDEVEHPKASDIPVLHRMRKGRL